MGLLSKLFGGSSHSKSELEHFGERCVPAGMQAAMQMDLSRDLKVAGALAALVMGTGHSFAVGYRRMLGERLGGNAPKPTHIGYDHYMIEASAYCMQLVAALNRSEPISGLAGSACRDAPEFCEGFADTHASATAPAGLFAARNEVYRQKARPTDPSDPAEFFAYEIMDAVTNDPGYAGSGPAMLDMRMQMTTMNYVPIFHDTHVKALLEMTSTLFMQADELIREAQAIL